MILDFFSVSFLLNLFTWLYTLHKAEKDLYDVLYIDMLKRFFYSFIAAVLLLSALPAFAKSSAKKGAVSMVKKKKQSKQKTPKSKAPLKEKKVDFLTSNQSIPAVFASDVEDKMDAQAIQDASAQKSEASADSFMDAEAKMDMEAMHKSKGTGQNISLTKSMIGAYGQSPLLSAEYKIKAAQMGLVNAQREWLPTAQAQVKYSRDSSKIVDAGSPQYQSAPTGMQVTETKTGQLRVEQNLYSGGATTANILASSKQLDAASAEYVSTEKAILFKAIRDHIDLYTKVKVWELNKKNESLLKESYRIAKDRHEFGELTMYDVAATKAKYEKAKGDAITAQAELKASMATYIKDTGVSTVGTVEKSIYPASLIPKTKEEALSLALQHSPDLKRVDAEADASKAKSDQAFGGLLPSFSIGATASRTLTETEGGRYQQGHFGSRTNTLGGDATLSIPLDFRGSTQSSVKQYKYLAAQKRIEALYQRREVMEKVSQAWDVWQASKARIEQVKSQVEAAKIAVDTVREEYLAGNKQTLDVLSAEQESFSAQVELVKSEQGEVQAAYGLLDAIGILRALYLNLEVPIYDLHQDQNAFWGWSIKEDSRVNTLQTDNEEMMQWGTNL